MFHGPRLSRKRAHPRNITSSISTPLLISLANSFSLCLFLSSPSSFLFLFTLYSCPHFFVHPYPLFFYFSLPLYHFLFSLSSLPLFFCLCSLLYLILFSLPPSLIFFSSYFFSSFFYLFLFPLFLGTLNLSTALFLYFPFFFLPVPNYFVIS